MDNAVKSMNHKGDFKNTLKAISMFFFATIIGTVGIPFIYLIDKHRLRQQIQQMRNQSRFLDWQIVQERLQSDYGTLIVEGSNTSIGRYWWTEENINEISDLPIPSKDELDYPGVKPPTEFVKWCYKRYLEPTQGIAFLTKPTRGTIQELGKEFRSKPLPNNVVFTVFYIPYEWKKIL